MPSLPDRPAHLALKPPRIVPALNISSSRPIISGMVNIQPQQLAPTMAWTGRARNRRFPSLPDRPASSARLESSRLECTMPFGIRVLLLDAGHKRHPDA